LRKIAVGLVALSCLGVGGAMARINAGPTSFLDEKISPALVVQDADVVDVLTTLLQRYDIPIRETSEDIQGEVSGRIAEVTVSEILNRLGALHDFYWYYDGSYLELGSSSGVTAGTARVSPSKIEAFLADLERMGMKFPQFPISVNEQTGVVFIHGPESLQTIVGELADQYQDDPPAGPAPSATVNVIYGRMLAGGSRAELAESAYRFRGQAGDAPAAGEPRR